MTNKNPIFSNSIVTSSLGDLDIQHKICGEDVLPHIFYGSITKPVG